MRSIERRCVNCRQMKPREELLRLTVQQDSSEVLLNLEIKTAPIQGRSAYLCKKTECVEQALRANKLKGALEGGRGRKNEPRRKITWPLEPQLMNTLRTFAQNQIESCQNS